VRPRPRAARRAAVGLAAALALAAAESRDPAPACGQTAPPGAIPDTTEAGTPRASEADLEIDAQKRELESLRKELDERRQRSDELRGKEKSVQAQIRDLGVRLALTEKYLAALERRRRTVSANLGDATSELARTSAQLQTEQRRLAWRLAPA